MSSRAEGEEESLEALVQRTTDVYEALLQREIPNRDAEFNCGRSYLAAERADLAEDIFRRQWACGTARSRRSKMRVRCSLCALAVFLLLLLPAGLLESGYKPTDSRFFLVQCLHAQCQFVEAKIELQKLLQDDPEHAEGLEFAAQFQ